MGQIDGIAKIEIARDAMESLMGDWTAQTNLGLMAYGHRREADCSDIETIIPPGRVDPSEFLSRVRQITPRGKTPLSAAIEKAADELAFRDNPATVVVISDGIESCERDPCALANDLERAGIGFTAHVIGFGLDSEEEQESLACIAEQTGGRFIAASDASGLQGALGEVSAAVASAPEPKPEPEPEPEFEVSVDAPETALAGSSIEVTWSAPVDRRDLITIVPAGADEDEVGNHVRVKDDTSSGLRVPGETGLYEVRYVLDEGRRTLAAAPVEVTEPEVRVEAPETALAGSSIEVTWSAPVDRRDLITIVPAGADEDEVGNHVRVKDDNSSGLRVPGETGLYEVRYVLDEGRRTLAAAPIEVTEPEVHVEAPETALAGSSIEVSWSTATDRRDLITIVPADADEDEVGNHVRVKDDTSSGLRVPGEAGFYEVRYVLDEGRRTLTAAPIEVTEPEVSVDAPETALAGSSIEVTWSTATDRRDLITIVPAGADEDEVGNHVRVKDDNSSGLRVPGETGLYEVRYVLDEGRRTLAATPVEVTEPAVQLTATETVRANGEISVRWEGDTNGRDIVTIVPMGSEEGEVKGHKRVRDRTEATLRAPKETGVYEVRFVLEEGRRTLARATVEVIAEDAALDRGGSLDVPDTAAPGETVQVGWSSSSASQRQRIALARRDQSDFTWIEVEQADNEPPRAFTMPEEPGTYEFRLLDLAGPAVLSRAIIEVQ
ncbi:hypothetical protein ACFQEX_11690 [Roseibium salinum]|uniref:vWA domain-containing protein n=1 Tax=Roseibium salinum TaxID=1604349 RepID=UPI003611C5D3